MNFFHTLEETKLVELDENDLNARLEKHVKPLKGITFNKDQKDYLFNGIWNRDGFSISLRLRIANNFIPVINGSILNSNEGTLIQLTFEMFPATKRLLLFWTLLTLLITIFFVAL